MKLLGADGLVSGINALNQIPTDYLTDGDVVCAKYQDKFYWYILEQNGVSESIPYIIEPLSDPSKRWVLSSIYMKEFYVDDIYANSLSQQTSGAPLLINNNLEFDGTEITFLNEDTAPFSVNSNVMVSNLNVEFLGGKRWDEVGGANVVVGEVGMLMNTNTTTATFDVPRFNSTYAIVLEIVNVIDYNPSLFIYMITDKTNLGFTVTLSSTIDSGNYRLQYAILGDNIDHNSYNLLTSLGEQIIDTGNDSITVS